MAIRNQIIGLIRFSYPATEGFAASRLGQAALEELLYDPRRLTMRFAYLETLVLPTLAAQTDGDFICGILAGDTLPQEWQDRLRALTDRFPFVRPIFLERMGPLPAAKRSFRRCVETDATHVTGFRLDDDDALAVDYIEKTRDRADRLIAGGFAEKPACVAFTRGLYWNLNAPGEPFHRFREAFAPSLACAMITAPDMPTCIYRYNHRRIASFIPTYLEPGGQEMFVRTQHDTNDSNRVAPPHAEAIATAEAAKLLRKRFALDADRVFGLMPVRPAGW
ncbi:glycosyltransferase [Jannaschia marina]|uniref:glycosyltransferase n=1 Tax=Jannaschia marina TaxID=2741674 RepID=UPI0015C72490|nr:glycosyltransferase [Jannaschia marina]